MQPRALALSFLALGCGASHGAPHDAGTFVDPRAHLCAPGDAATTPPFSTMEQVFDENCVTCHGDGADLDLTAGRAWANLVGRPAPTAESCGGVLVVPGDPDHSYLYQKLSSPKPCAGDQMPRGEFSSEPLPSCLVELVRQWIAGGALDGRD